MSACVACLQTSLPWGLISKGLRCHSACLRPAQHAAQMQTAATEAVTRQCKLHFSHSAASSPPYLAALMLATTSTGAMLHKITELQ